MIDDALKERMRAQAHFDLDLAAQLLREFGSVKPMFVGLDADPAMTTGADHVIFMPRWRNEPEKALAVSMARMVFAFARCQMASTIVEAWTVPQQVMNQPEFWKTARLDRYLPGTRPSEREDRIEVVQVSVESRLGWAHMAYAEIQRGDDGKPTGLGSPIADDGFPSKYAKGALTGLLGFELPPGLIVEARELLRRHGRTRKDVLH